MRILFRAFMIYRDPLGITLLPTLQLGFNHLHEHKLRHNFTDTVNPLCSCYLETESTEHYMIHCHNYATFHTILMNEFSSINSKFNTSELDEPIRTILYADNDFNFKDIPEKWDSDSTVESETQDPSLGP